MLVRRGAWSVLVLLALAGTALAESRARARQAAVLVDQGIALSKAGNENAALEKFFEAHRVFPSAKIVFNLAASLRKLERRAEAAEAYERFLVETADSTTLAESWRKTARERLRELRASLGRLRVEVTPPHARVLVDGAANGSSVRY